jgi:phosphoribosyl-ATP pyrophosphohydrolase
MSFTLEALDERLRERAAAGTDESYTARLLAAGTDRCARKFGEEAVEAIVAATTGDRAGLTGEAADVLYHLLVLLRSAGVPLAEVMAELEGRTGRSGLEEKASRRDGRS